MRYITLATAIFAVTWTIHGASSIEAAIAAQASIAYEAFMATAPFTTRSAPVSKTPDIAALKAAVLAGNFTSRLHDSTRSRCPQNCSSAGLSSHGWFVYHSVERLGSCESTMLLNFALFNDLDSSSHVSIAACTADLEQPVIDTRLTGTNAICPSNGLIQTEVTSSMQLSSSGASSSTEVADVVTALQQLQAVSALSGANCNETIRFAYSGNVAVGVYVGSGLANHTSSILQQLRNQVQSDGNIGENLVVQLCDNRTARHSLGIFISSGTNNLFAVQHGVQSWKNASCIITINSKAWQNITFSIPALHNSSSVRNSTTLRSQLLPRDSCTTVQVEYPILLLYPPSVHSSTLTYCG